MIAPHRRQFLGGLCSCSLLGLAGCVTAANDGAEMQPGYRPALSSDEGGLWHVMDKAERDIKRSRHLIRDQALQNYVRGVVTRLSDTYSGDMRTYLLRTPYFNATMAPNGMMQVWSGLLLRVTDEAQLAAVLGHEIGHYVQRHSLARIRDMRNKADVGVFLGAAFGLAGGIAQLTLMASSFAFVREQEREADDIGMELMTKAGYRPMAASEIWQQIIEEKNADPNPKSEAIMFATHPTNEERVTTLKLKAEAAGNRGEGYSERYRAAIRGVRFSLLEDELRLQQFDRTLVLLRRLQAATPADGELIYFEGEVYRLRDREDDRKRALDTYARAIAAEEPPPQAWRSLGLVQFKSGQNEAAQNSFRRYLEILPDAEDRAIIKSYMDKIA